MLYYSNEGALGSFFCVVFLQIKLRAGLIIKEVLPVLFYTEVLQKQYYAEGLEMRTRITLACTECKNRNYDTKKDKKLHPDRMETKKYCRFCKTHTLHKETK